MQLQGTFMPNMSGGYPPESDRIVLAITSIMIVVAVVFVLCVYAIKN